MRDIRIKVAHIAALNLVVPVGIVRVFRDMRRGVYDEQELAVWQG